MFDAMETNNDKEDTGVFKLGAHLLVELLVNHIEDLQVDGQHEEQRWEDPAEEVEVDHVVHADDRLKLAGHQKVFCDDGAVVLEGLQVVPAQHGREAHYDGHEPAEEHGDAGSPRRHQPLVAITTNERGENYCGCFFLFVFLQTSFIIIKWKYH